MKIWVIERVNSHNVCEFRTNTSMITNAINEVISSMENIPQDCKIIIYQEELDIGEFTEEE